MPKAKALAIPQAGVWIILTTFIVIAALFLMLNPMTTQANELPNATYDEKPEATSGLQKAVFAGGCFWGVEAVFQSVKGVSDSVSGYAGGPAANANYDSVSEGNTGHAEAVEVTYDPKQVTYGQLLKVFFAVAHDPTQLNRQGPDHGTQYRSAIFTTTPEQKKIADAYIGQLTQARSFSSKIVTQVAPLEKFYAAEAYHQDYAANNPDNTYIKMHDAPKLANLRKQFPQMCATKK